MLVPTTTLDSSATAVTDGYRSLESPRHPPSSQPHSQSASLCSIQIQVESRSDDGVRRPVATTHGVRRRLSGLPTTSASMCGSPRGKSLWKDRCRSVPSLVMTLVMPPTVVLVLLKFSVAYVMLFVLDVVVAMAAWEWSWWSFRIRQRLLAPFRHELATNTTTNNPTDTPTNMQDEEQDLSINQEALALSWLTKRCKTLRRHVYSTAGVLSVVLGATVVVVVGVLAEDMVTNKHSHLGRVVLVVSTSIGAVLALFCGLLASTLADGFVVFVYQACFVVSSLNSFLAHHEHLVHDPELLDSLYVLLVGACAIVVWRIVSSKQVLESTIMAMLDILGLAYLVAPMMAMADFLGHPLVNQYGDVVGTFFIVVSAAEAAFRLNDYLRDQYPHVLQQCRRPIVKNVSGRIGWEGLLLSVVFGIVGSIVSVLCFHGYMIHFVDGLVYLSVVLMSQLCRMAIESMKDLAQVNAKDMVTYQPWINGFMDLVNPYLLAMIAFHPYVKALIKST